MKKRDTEYEIDGIIREIFDNGVVCEFSSKDGQEAGLCREIYNDEVTVTLFKDGEEIASFSFDHEFKLLEEDRYAKRDQDGYFGDMTPDQFRKEN